MACILFYSKAKFILPSGRQTASDWSCSQIVMGHCLFLLLPWLDRKQNCCLETAGFSHFMLFTVHSLHPQSDWVLCLVNPNCFRTWKNWCLKFSVCVHFIPAGHDWCCFLPGLYPGPHDGCLPCHADRERRSLLPSFSVVSTRVFCGWFNFHLPPSSGDASQGKTGKWTISLKICVFCNNRIWELLKYWKQWR